jgi:hypothetical protein
LVGYVFLLCLIIAFVLFIVSVQLRFFFRSSGSRQWWLLFDCCVYNRLRPFFCFTVYVPFENQYVSSLSSLMFMWFVGCFSWCSSFSVAFLQQLIECWGRLEFDPTSRFMMMISWSTPDNAIYDPEIHRFCRGVP